MRTVLLDGSMTTSELEALHATHRLPSGLSAIAVGIWLIWVNDVAASLVVPAPSGIVAVTRREPVSMTETVLSLALVTYARDPSGENAVFQGVRPTPVRPTGRSVAVSTTTTASLSVSVTYACRPSAVTATPWGLRKSSWTWDTAPVAWAIT